MGYYTDFEITVTDVEGNELGEVPAALVSALMDMELDDFGGNVFTGSLKWYDYGEDMVKLSKQFPDLLFTVEGHGESQDDIWRLYYQNGRFQGGNAEIVYPQLDEQKWRTE